MRIARHATAARLLAGTLLLALASASPLAAAGCGGRPAPPRTDAARSDPPDAGVRVRLAFGADADLDLHVTDPLQETLYFANRSAASGGRLEADVRCSDPPPRVETVVFEDPPPGRYRVGVDFPIRCRRVDAPAPYVLEVWVRGVRHEARSAVAFGTFQPVVYEFDVPPAP